MKDALEWAHCPASDLAVNSKPAVHLQTEEHKIKVVDRQLYTVLAQLCEGEALDLVHGTRDKLGSVACRAISIRFGPQGCGRCKTVMGQLFST